MVGFFCVVFFCVKELNFDARLLEITFFFEHEFSFSFCYIPFLAFFFHFLLSGGDDGVDRLM